MILKPDVSRSSVLDAIMVIGAAVGSPAVVAVRGALVARPDRGISRRAHPERNHNAWQGASLLGSRRGLRHKATAGRLPNCPPADQAHGRVVDLPVAEAGASVEVAQRRRKRGGHLNRNVVRPLHTLRHPPLCLRTVPSRRTRFPRELRTHQAKFSARSFATVMRTRSTGGSGRGAFPVCSRSPRHQCAPGRRSDGRVERSGGRATMAAITSQRASTARPRRSTISRRMQTAIGAAIVCWRTSGRGTSVPVERSR